MNLSELIFVSARSFLHDKDAAQRPSVIGKHMSEMQLIWAMRALAQMRSEAKYILKKLNEIVQKSNAQKPGLRITAEEACRSLNAQKLRTKPEDA